MTRVKLGEVARESKLRDDGRKPLPSVGLEHLDSGDVTLRRWDEGGSNTFTKRFLPGQVLFGRRRAYLQKAAVAPFEGLCSGDIITVEAIPGAIHERLLPFVIQNPSLFDFAVGKSAGSLSPRVKWGKLAEFDFDLPEMAEQQELADILWTAEGVKEHYRSLIKSSGDLVKSQFVEMFGESSNAKPGVEIRKLGDLLSVQPQNGLYKSQKYYVADGTGTPIVRVDGFNEGSVANYESLKRLSCTDEEIQLYGLNEDDIVINRVNGSVLHVGKCARIQGLKEPTVFESNMMRFHIDETLLDITFAVAFLCSTDVRNQILKCARVANQASINQENVKNLLMLVPSVEDQSRFSAFVQQVDKSKFALQKSLDDLDAMAKKLMNEELGLGNV